MTKEPDILGPHAVLSWRHSAQREREGVPCSPSVAAHSSTIHQEAFQQVVLSSDVIVWGRPVSSLRLSASPRFLARPQSFCLSVSLSRPPTAVLLAWSPTVWVELGSSRNVSSNPDRSGHFSSSAAGCAVSSASIGQVVLLPWRWCRRDAAQLCCPWPHGWHACAS